MTIELPLGTVFIDHVYDYMVFTPAFSRFVGLIVGYRMVTKILQTLCKRWNIRNTSTKSVFETDNNTRT